MMHRLVFLQDPPYPTGFFLCDLCHERGSGSVFHCSACYFDLHPTCVATGEHTSHFSHFKHPLTFQTLASNSTHTCDGCGDSVYPSVYNCSLCNYDLHPHCARAPRFLQHPSHKHPLMLTTKGEAYPGSGPCWCDGCGQEAEKLVYHCSTCKYDIHIFCAMSPCNPLHVKHPEHRLKLLYRPEKRAKRALCSECGQESSKWMYGCEQCGFFMHARCANIPSHEVAPQSTGRSSSPASSRDVEAVVKVMDKLLLSSDSVSANEARAVRRIKKMLEEQQQSGPVTVSSAASRVSRDGVVDRQSCGACLDDYESEKQRRSLRCGHHFHTSCILKWMENDNRCPVCRQQVMIMEEH